MPIVSSPDLNIHVITTFRELHTFWAEPLILFFFMQECHYCNKVYQQLEQDRRLYGISCDIPILCMDFNQNWEFFPLWKMMPTPITNARGVPHVLLFYPECDEPIYNWIGEKKNMEKLIEDEIRFHPPSKIVKIEFILRCLRLNWRLDPALYNSNLLPFRLLLENNLVNLKNEAIQDFFIQFNNTSITSNEIIL